MGPGPSGAVRHFPLLDDGNGLRQGVSMLLSLMQLSCLLNLRIGRRTFRLGRNVRRRYVSAEEKRTPPSRRYVSLEEKRTPQLGFSWGVRFAWGETYAPPAPYVSPRQKRTPAYVSPQEKRTPADPQIEQA